MPVRMDSVENALKNIVGEENVTSDRTIMYPYTRDFTIYGEGWPDFVVRPKTVKEIQDILRLANREKIPVTPMCYGLNPVGLTIPTEGGILLDLKRMDKIIEINEESMYAVVEPGVTFAQLYAEVSKRGFFLSVPAAPISVSVLTNHLAPGLGSTNVWGWTQDFNTLCLEVVLPTGEIVRTGGAALPRPAWYNRFGAGPDLTGLFIGALGAFGVVTKLACKLWRKPEVIEIRTLGYKDLRSSIKPIKILLEKRIIDHIQGGNWLLMAATTEKYPMEEADKGPMSKEQLDQWRKRLGFPEIYWVVGLLGTKNIVNAKLKDLEEVIKEHGGEFFEPKGEGIQLRKDLVEGKPSLIAAKLMGHRSGGYVAPVSYPQLTPKLQDVYDEIMEVGRRYGFDLALNMKPGPEGRITLFRFCVLWNRNNEEETKRARMVVREIWKTYAKHDLPIPPSPRFEDLNMTYAGTGQYFELLKRIKKTIDPNNIMTPGRFGI